MSCDVLPIGGAHRMEVDVTKRYDLASLIDPRRAGRRGLEFRPMECSLAPPRPSAANVGVFIYASTISDEAEPQTRMFSHIMVGSNDIERSKRFYDAVLGTLGVKEPLRNISPSGHTRLFYRHEGNTFCITQPINGEPATAANGGTIAFKCSSPEQVQAFHDTAVAHGGTSIEDPPGLRTMDLGSMYLAYVRDPDGNKLCAIHRIKKER